MCPRRHGLCGMCWLRGSELAMAGAGVMSTGVTSADVMDVGVTCTGVTGTA